MKSLRILGPLQRTVKQILFIQDDGPTAAVIDGKIYAGPDLLERSLRSHPKINIKDGPDYHINRRQILDSFVEVDTVIYLDIAKVQK